MNGPIDHESIARAMKEAAWVAKHGTREQRSGRFLGPKTSLLALDAAKSSPKPSK